MKPCRTCQKEIDDKASKCPYCQEYQKWSKNPHAMSIISSVIFLPIAFLAISFLFYSNHENNKAPYAYLDHKNDFEINSVNMISNRRTDVHIYSITNKTDRKWDDIVYQLIGYDSAGKVVVVKSEGEFHWTIQPNSQSMISVEIDRNNRAVEWEFKITDMSLAK